MNNYADDINDALRELEDLRNNPENKESSLSYDVSLEFTVSPEISKYIRQRRADSERMRHISVGVYS